MGRGVVPSAWSSGAFLCDGELLVGYQMMVGIRALVSVMCACTITIHVPSKRTGTVSVHIAMI